MPKSWVEKNAGQSVEHVREQLRFGPLTYVDLVRETIYSFSTIRAACRLLKVVDVGNGERQGTSGRFPTLWALPKEKRR
jgi:hypothetical protein